MPKKTPDDTAALAEQLAAALAALPESERIDALNAARRTLATASPYHEHPTDCTEWVPAAKVISNDYNPNRVARPEMKLLRDSVEADGVTMNIVVYHDEDNDLYVVVDGFHRWTLLAETLKMAHVPVSVIRSDLANRMASTVRHNRARGKHAVQLMSDMVAKLLDLGWKEARIAKHLGMEAEEVLRLKREAGIGSHYARQPHSKAWVRDTDDALLTAAEESR